MKRLVFAATAVAMTAGPALSQAAHILEFNGFSVLVSVRSVSTPPDFTEADEAAEKACKSVGKHAEMQYRDRISDWRHTAFYVCL